MVDIKFPLVGGNTATFFFSNAQNLIVIGDATNGTCTLVDSLHNNGGWKIALPAKNVTDSLRKLFTRGI